MEGDDDDDLLNITPTPTMTINRENAPICSSTTEKNLSQQQQHSIVLNCTDGQKEIDEIVDYDESMNESTTILNISFMADDEIAAEDQCDDEKQVGGGGVATNTATYIHHPPHPRRQTLGVIKNTKNNLTICDDGQEEGGSSTTISSTNKPEVMMKLVIEKMPNGNLLKEKKDDIDESNEDRVEELATTSTSTSLPSNIKLPETKRPIKIYDTIEEFEANLPATVTVLNTSSGSKVYLVGTAHFSEDSKDDVSYVSASSPTFPSTKENFCNHRNVFQVIRNVRPDVLVVELCSSRMPLLKLDEKTLTQEARTFTFSKVNTIDGDDEMTDQFSFDDLI